MGGQKDDLGWRPIMIFAAIVLATFVLHQVWPQWTDYCPTEEELAACSREWVSALAGWAATIAAAVTIIYLVRQNAEQKKQTDFLLGNSKPTVDAIHHLRIPQVAVVRVVNWNRRPVILHKVRMNHDGHTHAFRRTIVWDRDDPKTKFVQRKLNGATIDPPIPMHGWKDRSGPPCEVRIDVLAYKDRRLSTEWAGASVTIEMVVAGEDGEPVIICCPISVAQ